MLPLQLPWYDTGHAALDRLPPAEVARLQLERLQAIVAYVYHSSSFYRQKFEAAGVRPEDIRSLNDVRDLPFTTKAELQADQEAHPPFGTYTCSHPSTWYRAFATSGTTGRPLNRLLSFRDWELCRKLVHRRSYWSSPSGGSELTIHVSLHPTEGLFGPSLAAEAQDRPGALRVPLGRYRSEQKVRLIHELKPTSVTGTVSYLLYLGRLAEEMQRPFYTLSSIRALITGFEPGATEEGTQRRIKQLWGESVAIVETYGLTEIFGVGGGCPDNPKLHIPCDVLLTEIVDPETGNPVPPGEAGELVFTNLIHDTHPLIRYRSGDLARADPNPACNCSSVVLLNGIEGRVDDMIVYRGVNIYPSAVERVLRSFPEMGEEFQLVLTGTYERPELIIRIEPHPAATSIPLEQVQHALRTALGVQVQVACTRPGTLTRSEYKARRIVDERFRPEGRPAEKRGVPSNLAGRGMLRE